MAQAAAKMEKPEPQVAAEPKPVEVEPNKVMVDIAGHARRWVSVRCPEGMVQDDLRSPKIWRRVQADRGRALLKHDDLYILGFDESWFAEAIVCHATNAEASLVIKKVGSFREQSQTFYSDGTYQVFWDGAGFGVRRIEGGVRMGGQSFHTEGLAQDYMRSLYSTAVA